MTILLSEVACSDQKTLSVTKRAILATVGVMALCLGVEAAQAQATNSDPVVTSPSKSTPADGELINSAGTKPGETTERTSLASEAPTPANEGEITVTGTRIVRDGYSAPTPVSVISSKEIAAEVPANITDFVNTLPAVRGSATAANSNGALSNGQAGIATVNLRNLGSNRTLVLFDGIRSVASAGNGVVDVNTFPQSLIQRVEVVTGGASSAYGSDAVSGVVNFILDRSYKGVKADYEFGITDYGDGQNHKASITAGTDFGPDGQGHILASGEFFTQAGQHTIDRPWNNYGYFRIVNPAYVATTVNGVRVSDNGLPEQIVASSVGLSGSTPGGLITSGALRGVYFTDGANGQIVANGLAAGTSRLNFPTTAISGQWLVGNDWLTTRAYHNDSSTLIPDEERKTAFGRVSWKFSDALEIYGQASYAKYHGVSYYQATYSTGVTIQNDNAFLPQSVKTAMAAANLTSVSVGFGNDGIPAQGSANTREVYRYVLGGSGQFEVANRAFKYEVFGQKGIAKTDEQLINTYQTQYLSRATDAVTVTAANVGTSGLALGSIACRYTLTHPGDSCVPINRFGNNVSPAALNYIFNGGNQPLREQTLKQTFAGANISAPELFDLWAGPVSLTLGGEYRKESISGSVDPQFSVDQTGPDKGVAKWIYGNYFPTFGSYNVKEVFAETVIPLFKGADLNGAFRHTNYSTSGTVNTWKVGGTYQIIEDLKLRGTVSRDIRAPSLQELFSIVGRSNAISVPLANGTTRSDNFFENTYGSVIGNAATPLTPEVAKTYGGGAVITPRFLRGFAASVDYYKINLKGAIDAISAQNIVNLCYRDNQPQYCSQIQTANGLAAGPANIASAITGINLYYQNFASVKTEGIDIEASYRTRIDEGALTLRALATHYINYLTNNGINPVTDSAGNNNGSVPNWTYRLSAGWDQGPFSGQLVARGVSSGKYSQEFVECTSACPLSNSTQTTINDNTIPGAWYFDVSASYKLNVGPTKVEIFGKINNLLNSNPVLVANGPTGNNTPAYPQTNRNLYDVLGRVYRMGIRVAY
ncbi:TonB-dependent receptor [Sphingomonas sp. BIUV-7]|uniref:TonB-dependent receptor n=1 Tax=Sphingomonas natans TaxID=3063330 RepID=A0ABT8Y8Y2_9SPHN|nr:TonB-dependent receptor [Sphingomonas sp. BIUV-7]MDO6414788.1 TonB-dependent receptor [Sphingomonas sp. BIUV-7]